MSDAHSRDDVLAALQSSFDEKRWPHVMKLLDAYGLESYERERERVQLAILALSAGSEEKLIEHVAVAKHDYRDVLFWADNPEETKIDTPEKRSQVLQLFKKLGVEPPRGLAETIALRDADKRDLPVLFKWQSDPESSHLAGFIPKERAAFTAHWTKILGDASITKKIIIYHGSVAGYLVSFERGNQREVGYWIGREFWGKGVATEALAAFLALDERRPLYARIAMHNARSIRVAEKCGFKRIGEDRFSNAAGENIEEFVFELRGQ